MIRHDSGLSSESALQSARPTMPELTQRHVSLSLRIWHWLNAAVVTGLLTTYFLKQWLLDNSRALMHGLIDKNIATMDESQYRPLIRERVDDLWQWHIYFGYALTVLLLWRAILLALEPGGPFREFRISWPRWQKRKQFRAFHEAVVRSTYVLFYGLQVFMVASGLSLAFAESLGIERPTRRWLHEWHETVMWAFLVFVILHLLGVAWAELSDQPGLVSSMIHGRNKPDRRF